MFERQLTCCQQFPPKTYIDGARKANSGVMKERDKLRTRMFYPFFPLSRLGPHRHHISQRRFSFPALSSSFPFFPLFPLCRSGTAGRRKGGEFVNPLMALRENLRSTSDLRNSSREEEDYGAFLQVISHHWELK